jgi:pimeloyl-ACP methyl ester carboxylesterase
MAEFDRGEVRANGLRFHYLEMGEGPLALCLHGFPDSPYTYRYLLPELAGAGYRAVAPFNRGFAPTEVPSERRHVHTSTMVAVRSLFTKRSAGTKAPCSSLTIGGHVPPMGPRLTRRSVGGGAPS